MSSYIVIIISLCLIVAYYFYSNRKKTVMEINRLLKLDKESKKIELEKLKMKVDKNKTNHILHFFITLFTSGAWALIWIIITMSNSSERAKIEKLIESI